MTRSRIHTFAYIVAGLAIVFLPSCRKIRLMANEDGKIILYPRRRRYKVDEYNRQISAQKSLHGHVGSDSGRGMFKPRAAAASRSARADVTVALACKADGSVVEIGRPNVTIKGVSGIKWKSVGEPGESGYLPTWTVKLDSGKSPCAENDIHNAEGYRVCSVKSDAAADIYTYKVHSEQCNIPWGQASRPVWAFFSCIP